MLKFSIFEMLLKGQADSLTGAGRQSRHLGQTLMQPVRTLQMK